MQLWVYTGFYLCIKLIFFDRLIHSQYFYMTVIVSSQMDVDHHHDGPSVLQPHFSSCKATVRRFTFVIIIKFLQVERAVQDGETGGKTKA